MQNGSRAGSRQSAEWRALHTQFDRDHVLGTVPYRWETEHSEATLVEARSGLGRIAALHRRSSTSYQIR